MEQNKDIPQSYPWTKRMDARIFENYFLSDDEVYAWSPHNNSILFPFSLANIARAHGKIKLKVTHFPIIA